MLEALEASRAATSRTRTPDVGGFGGVKGCDIENTNAGCWRLWRRQGLRHREHERRMLEALEASRAATSRTRTTDVGGFGGVKGCDIENTNDGCWRLWRRQGLRHREHERRMLEALEASRAATSR